MGCVAYLLWLGVSLAGATPLWLKHHPKTWDAAAVRFYVHRHDPCLASVVELEDGSWNPRVGFGHVIDAVNSSYGLPQANPGTKMTSAGRDWARNPWTQLLWMNSYVERYGGSCGALAFRRANGYY